MPAKKAAGKKKATNTANRNKTKKPRQPLAHQNVYWGAMLFVVVLLLFVSLLARPQTIRDDMASLRAAELTFSRVIRLDFPALDNPLGPVGAYTGYFFLTVFGQFFALCLLVGLAAISACIIFIPDNQDARFKAVAFIILAFFATIILLNYTPFYQASLDTFPLSVYNWMMSLVRATGAIIISGAICLLCLMIIFGAESVRNAIFAIFKVIYMAIYKLFKGITQMLAVPFRDKESAKSEPRPKKRTPVKPDIEVAADNGEEEDPNIFDHAYKDDDETETKPVPTRRKRPPKVDEAEFDHYIKPDIDLFLTSPPRSGKADRHEMEEEIKRTSTILRDKLAEFGIEAQVVNANIGPIITQYELKPAPGVKVSRFQSFADDLALAIKAETIRVQAPIPGRGLVGIEVPNSNRDTIYLKDVLLSDEMAALDSPLALALGKDTSGTPVVTDLARMPHLLIAGATGSGKSVCLNTMINSILLRQTPDEVRFIMIDPKMIELSGYEGIPHLIQNVVTDPDEALSVLNWGVSEMEWRYEMLLRYKARDIGGYNSRLQELRDKGEEVEDESLPHVIMIVDEFADLIMSAGRDIELPIARLAQKARAIGIHLILATQRPSTKVITGLIKANFPARIAFRVSTKIDSRVILDQNGAETLLGRGDMLFLPPGKAMVERIHGAFVADREIEELVEYLRKMPKPDLEIEFAQEMQSGDLAGFESDDELFMDAAQAIVSAGTASVSMLQRHFKIGYARAGRLVDMLEQAGVIGPHVGSKSREVLMAPEDLNNDA
ncbi:MAG: DUF87 domain-containing protein [Candidatus Cloacimonetes bacterium]|nr:DUF87 domain-containing protein [Candidatus Cloacimonadota bacterium]